MKKTVKLLSVILSVILAFGVCALPFGVSAATAGSYAYSVDMNVTGDMDAVYLTYTLYGRAANGTGAETVITSGTWSDKDLAKGIVNMASGTTDGVFPTRLCIEDIDEPYWFVRSLTSTVSITVAGKKVYLDASVTDVDKGKCEVGSGTDAAFNISTSVANSKLQFRATYAVAASEYPYPAAVELTGGSEILNAPAIDGNSVAYTSAFSAVPYDQYGVVWGATQIQWSNTSVANCALSMSSASGDSSKLGAPAFTANSVKKDVTVTAAAAYGGKTASASAIVTVYPTYRRVYDANGGTLDAGAQAAEYVRNLTAVPEMAQYDIPAENTASREGYTFMGWNADKNAAAGTRSAAVFGYDTTLYAIWSPNIFYVNFYGSGSTSGTMSQQSFTYGFPQKLTANKFVKSFIVPFKSNGGTAIASATATSRFLGWAKRAGGTVSFTDNQEVQDLQVFNGAVYELYAVWQDEAITLPDCEKTGYTFGGWYTDAALTDKAGDAGDAYVVGTATTLYAKWDCVHPAFSELVITEPTCGTAGKKVFTCTRCGYQYYEDINPDGHAYGPFIYDGASVKTHTRICSKDAAHTDTQACAFTSRISKQPKCNEEGVRTYTCSVCGGTYTQAVEKIAHTPGSAVTENENAPSCKAPGSYDEVTYCIVCGEEASRTTHYTEQLAHTEIEIPAVTPTCSAEGFSSGAKCSVCGTVTIAPVSLGFEEHTPETVKGTAATCTRSGLSDGVKCSVCETVITAQTVLPALGHLPGEETRENEKAATCVKTGSYYSVIRCERCAALITRTAVSTPLADHTPEEIPAVAANCRTEGFTAGTKCSFCGKILTAPVSLGYGSHNIVKTGEKAATCSEAGYTGDMTCSVCGYTQTQGEIIPKTPHTPKTAPGIASTCVTHGYSDAIVCIECLAELTPHEELPFADHTPGTPVRENEKAATCTVKGSYDEVVYCEFCENEISRKTVPTDFAAHTPGTPATENVKPATCTVKGSYDKVTRCTVCEKVITKETVTTDFAAHTPTAAVKENIVNGSCTVAGSYDEVVKCAVCGAELSRKNVKTSTGSHTPGAEVRQNVTAATCTQAGVYEAVVNCKVCGAELSRTLKTTPLASHRDGNGDGRCDECGADVTVNCGHLCHKSGFSGFIWKILNFFNKLFKINQYCECGAKHW